MQVERLQQVCASTRKSADRASHREAASEHRLSTHRDRVDSNILWFIANITSAQQVHPSAKFASLALEVGRWRRSEACSLIRRGSTSAFSCTRRISCGTASWSSVPPAAVCNWWFPKSGMHTAAVRVNSEIVGESYGWSEVATASDQVAGPKQGYKCSQSHDDEFARWLISGDNRLR